MVLETLQVIVGLLMVFFIPGFAFVRMLFPRKEDLDPEYGLLYQITLGMGMSIVIVILDGMLLASLEPNAQTGKGYFDAPYLWASLILLTLVFFVAGWLRGGYPILGRIHPSLLRYPKGATAKKMRRGDLNRYIELTKKRDSLLKKLKDTERKITVADKDLKTHYESKRTEIIGEIETVDDEIASLDKKGEERPEQKTEGEKKDGQG
jgi:hypothetical protein